MTIISSPSIAFLLLDATGLTVGRVAPEEHRLEVILLRDIGLVLEHTVDPARHRNSLGVHDVHILALALLVAAAVELTLDPFVVEIPDARPVLPGSGRKAVVPGQRIGEHAEVGSALHVIVAAEDIRAAAGNTHIAERELERAVGAGIVVTDRVLGTTHAPDEGAGTIVCHRLGGFEHLVFGHAGDALDFGRIPVS